MTDFIDVLEQQLVAAHRRPERRRFVTVPWRATIVFAGAAAAAAVVVIAVLALASPTSQPAASSPPTQPPQTTPVHPPAPVAVLVLASPAPQPAASPPTQPPQTTPVHPPPPVRLAVLNGTTITGLARTVADELTSLGYSEPNIVTNDTTNQSRARTTVYFERGHREDALGVASCLHIRSDRVTAMGADERALSDGAQVAVVLGADRAR